MKVTDSNNKNKKRDGFLYCSCLFSLGQPSLIGFKITCPCLWGESGSLHTTHYLTKTLFLRIQYPAPQNIWQENPMLETAGWAYLSKTFYVSEQPSYQIPQWCFFHKSTEICRYSVPNVSRDHPCHRLDRKQLMRYLSPFWNELWIKITCKLYLHHVHSIFLATAKLEHDCPGGKLANIT